MHVWKNYLEDVNDEKGIYSIEMFSKRNAALSKEIEQLRESETDLLRQKREGNQ